MPQTLAAVAISIAISVAFSLVTSLIFPPARRQQPPMVQPAVPKPADGKYNFKQATPSLSFVYGRVKKPSDYVFLEETLGTAFHIMVPAGHRIHQFVQHYLHDEPVTLDGSGWVVAPAHFDSKVRLSTKLGEASQGYWSSIAGFFPSIWTADHRGDGLAQVVMECLSVAQEYYLKVYPQQMPVHTAIMDGARLYDPRTETTAFSRNLALIRLDHLVQPFGGKLTLDDLYLPEWEHAADVGDEEVTNRDGDPEPRYHGGLWARYSSDPVEVGRKIDEAGELVLYERPDGKIGVHAGEFVNPDITIEKRDLIEFQLDVNRRKATTVLAVRGRFTDPGAVYNTVDAAIWGDPYAGDDTQRTDTVDNEALQSHNHTQRLQKLRFIRANAPRVRFTVDLIDKGDAEDRRFLRLNLPERGLDNAIVEITGRPRISLKNLTLSLEGIVVPATLYSFNAALEEGLPGGAVASVEPAGVPVPENFAIGIDTQIVSGGETEAFGVASWDFVSDALTYELEYQLDDESEPPQTVLSRPGETEVRTPALRDGVEYRFRLRAVSNGRPSDWTAYETETAIADPVAPGQPTDFQSSVAGSDVTLSWVNPNSPNLFKTTLYRNGTNNFATAVAIYTANGGIGEARAYEDASLPAGTYWWWVQSENASEVPSTQVGPETQTI